MDNDTERTLSNVKCSCGATFPERWMREDHWNTAEGGSHGEPLPALLVHRDEQAEVHVGDRVRYVKYDWQVPQFYRKVGIVTEIRPSAVGIHFPHHAKGTQVVTVAEHVRLVNCKHKGESS